MGRRASICNLKEEAAMQVQDAGRRRKVGRSGCQMRCRVNASDASKKKKFGPGKMAGLCYDVFVREVGLGDRRTSSARLGENLTTSLASEVAFLAKAATALADGAGSMGNTHVQSPQSRQGPP